MSTKKPAPLTGSIITSKGQAAPSAPVSTPKPLDTSSGDDSRTSLGEVKRIAVTVRLTDEDYRRLKLHGLNTRKSNQEIIVEALTVFLGKS